MPDKDQFIKPNTRANLKLAVTSIFLWLIFYPMGSLLAQPFAKWTDAELTLKNNMVKRVIKLPGEKGNFLTTSYKPLSGAFKYFTASSGDFQFEINGTIYSGNSFWKLTSVKQISDARQGDGAAVTLESSDRKIEVTLNFLMYPNLPVIRKSLSVKNLDNEDVSLESVDTEKFSTTGYWASTHSWIYTDYGRRKKIGSYEGNMQDALVVVHNMDVDAGIVIGNEASGVLKHTTAFWNADEICSGLTHKNDRYPFRKWIKPQQSFETPQIFTMVYNNHKTPEGILNTSLPDFIRKHMGIRLSELKEKPTFVYNTWMPFKEEIDEKLMMELAKSAADAGMKEFVIDGGWQANYGDLRVDPIKFPRGLKPVFDYIKSLGMKPGLWVSVGSASNRSQVYKDHPEWFSRDKNGNIANLLLAAPGFEHIQSACFSTGWKDYIKDQLLKLSLDFGLEYLKLDFAVVTSPYIFDREKSGCYAIDHAHHKDQRESFYANYENMWKLFDELHAAKPNLFIDCTFETMGGLQLIDYAMLKHAEGNWLSNFEGALGVKTALRVRNMAWWRSPAIPATALVIGNPEMQDKNWEMHIKSLAGALPIMLGDPRKLTAPDFKKYRSYADWLQEMTNKHDIMSYRQDLKGFGEPQEGMWDGYQRVNTETQSGGIIGVFRQGGTDADRKVTIHYLDPAKSYKVKEALTGKVIIEAKGGELSKAGFKVNLPEEYDGKLFEVTVR